MMIFRTLPPLSAFSCAGFRHKTLFLGFSLILFSASAFSEAKNVSIDPSVTYQKIDHFTASDAWSGGFVGKYFQEAQKNQIAKWLFCQKTDETGNPQGIGLSMWRVNLGAGTLEQDSADIMPYQRRAESFMTKDGKFYDWNKCIGQQYFMQKAVEYGCNNFLLFSNSPLVQYTRNGKGWSQSGKFSNLRSDCYDKYADYMAQVAQYFTRDKSWNISYISPINEPQVDWTNNRQEGSEWKSSEMKRLFVALDKSLNDKNLEQVKILIGEAGSYDHLYPAPGSEKTYSKDDEPSSQIATFFDPQSPNYVGDLKRLPRLICGHGYGTHTTNKMLKDTRELLKAQIDKYGLDFHESEWCLLPNMGLKEAMDGFTKDWERGNHAGMQPALLLGRIIYSDFVYGNAKAWGYWKGMEINGDHALIAVYPKDGKLENGGNVRSNKLLWALGNYSLFIRPGYTRIGLQGADDLNTLAASAYMAPDKSRIVVVYVNSSFETFPVKVTLPKEYGRKVKAVSAFRTDDRSDLANMYVPGTYSPKNQYTVAPRSLMTLVLDL